MKLPIFLTLFIALVADAAPDNATLPSKQIAFFESKIRPVLAEACYECHNSSGKAKGDIALDWRDAMAKSGIIVPGSPEKSTLIQAIRHADDYEPMPSKKTKLAKLIIKNFETWIRMGAPDPRDAQPSKEDLAKQVNWDAVRDGRTSWWSYQPIKNPTPPEVRDKAWSQSAMDQFVKAKLDAEGLPAQVAASPEVLVRRVHQILIGIPPTPEVVQAFIADPSQTAYEDLVDDLLNSQRFGERWGRYWLDWFRYAESHGSEGDPSVPYPTVYRDYVIRALNADVPYDQLIREHIAGDLLDQPRINDQLGLNESAIGPAHFRMTPQGFGVTDAYAEQISFTDNQVDVITKAILGSTLSCARCHNHKFDPLSQKDYYKFYGMMISSRPAVINVDSPAVQHIHRAELKNLKRGIRNDLATQWASQIDATINALDTKSGSLKKAAENDEGHPFYAWFKLRQVNVEELPQGWDSLRKRHAERAKQNQERIANATFYADLRDQETYGRWFKNGTGLNETISPAGSFSIAPGGDRALTGIYPRGVYTHLTTDKDNGTLSSVFHQARGRYTGMRVIGNNATIRISARSYPLAHGGLHPSPSPKPQLGWVAINKYDYWNEEQVFYQLTTAADQTYRTGKGRGWFGVTDVYGGDDALNELGQPAHTLPGAPTSLKDHHELRAFYRAALTAAVADWKNETANDAQAALIEALRKHNLFSDEIAGLPLPLKESVAQYRKLESEIRIPVRAPGVMEGEPWDQPLLSQGLYKNEEEPVARGFLEAFGGRTYNKNTSGRLELAEDLLRKDNPLTARVIVNRLWHHIFGLGLVSSTDNFGRLGKPPSHPEMLDHLAHQFRNEDQWSMKKMIRRMITSRTFMSGSDAPAGAGDKDPNNALLSHYSPRRLDAEAIFDTLSFIAGGNQQPAIYRRAKRNNLDPFLTAFNYPVPTTSVGVRDLTNVPAQSLMMLNGQEARSAAEQWARRIESDRKLLTQEQRITALFSQAYSRIPTTEELNACIAYLAGKADDDELTKLVEEHAQAKHNVMKFNLAREQILAPVKARLQIAVDARNAAAKEAGDKQPIDLKPLARWDFEGDTKDALGNLHGEIKGDAEVKEGALVLRGGALFTSPLKTELAARTFEVLVQLDRTDQRGGGAMTLQTLDGNVFDSMVYGEQAPHQWLAGSDHFRRTNPFGGPADTECAERPVRMTIVFYSDGSAQAFRDGKAYGNKIRKSGAVTYAPGQAQIVMGLRHGTGLGSGRLLTGKIFEARLYDRALTPEEIAAAASGEQLEFVSEQDVLDALSSQDLKTVHEINGLLTTAEATLNALSRELDDQRAAQGGIPGGLTRLAHVLINSKELIYVY